MEAKVYVENREFYKLLRVQLQNYLNKENFVENKK